MTNPKASVVLQAFYAALNAKQLRQACQLLADDICLSTPEGDRIGKTAVCAYLRALVDADVTFAIGVTSSVGNTVYYTYHIFTQGTLIDTGEDGLARLANGLINFDGIKRDNFQQEQQV